MSYKSITLDEIKLKERHSALGVRMLEGPIIIGVAQILANHDLCLQCKVQVPELCRRRLVALVLA